MDREGTCRPTTMRSPDLAGPEDPARRDWRGKVGSLAAPKRIHGLRCQGGASYGRGLLAKPTGSPKPHPPESVRYWAACRKRSFQAPPSDASVSRPPTPAGWAFSRLVEVPPAVKWEGKGLD
jgi:hypothetical protein